MGKITKKFKEGENEIIENKEICQGGCNPEGNMHWLMTKNMLVYFSIISYILISVLVALKVCVWGKAFRTMMHTLIISSQ